MMTCMGLLNQFYINFPTENDFKSRKILVIDLKNLIINKTHKSHINLLAPDIDEINIYS